MGISQGWRWRKEQAGSSDLSRVTFLSLSLSSCLGCRVGSGGGWLVVVLRLKRQIEYAARPNPIKPESHLGVEGLRFLPLEYMYMYSYSMRVKWSRAE